MSLDPGKRLKDTFLLTDTLPTEVPIIYSNFTLYDYILDNEIWDDILDINDKKKYLSSTIPYYFTIKKNYTGKRQLALLHPISQLLLTKFNSLYDKEIIEYFKINDNFSIRTPKQIIRQKKVPFKLKRSKYKEWINKVIKFYYGYRFIRITDFYNSQLFYNCELKYSTLYKIDIQSFFDSIYTHSIEWAYLGNKKIAKKSKNRISNLGSLIDCIFQSVNYGETNGIVIGPEISRIISEIITTRVDSTVFTELSNRKLHINKDYLIIRFLDDIFIYANDENICQFISDTYERNFLYFKLTLNHQKSSTEKRPFNKKHLWVRSTYRIVKEIEEWFAIDSELFNKNCKKKNIRFRNYKIQDIKQILSEYTEQSNFILSYMTTSITSILKNISFSNDVQKLLAISKKQSFDSRVGKENYESRIKSIFELLHFVLVLSPTYKNATNFTSICYKVSGFNSNLEKIVFEKCKLLLFNNIDNLSEVLNIIIFLSTLNYDLPYDIIEPLLSNEEEYFNVSILSYYLSRNNRRFKYVDTVNRINLIIENFISDLNYEFPFSKKGTYTEEKLRDLLSDQKIIWLVDYFSCPIVNRRVAGKIGKVLTRIDKSISSIKEKYPIHYIVGKYFIERKEPFIKWSLTTEEVKNEINRRVKNRMQSVY